VQQLWIAGGGHWNLSDHRATSPIVLLRRALAKCPDEAPSPLTSYKRTRVYHGRRLQGEHSSRYQRREPGSGKWRIQGRNCVGRVRHGGPAVMVGSRSRGATAGISRCGRISACKGSAPFPEAEP
jgi:hypothetical protein